MTFALIGYAGPDGKAKMGKVIDLHSSADLNSVKTAMELLHSTNVKLTHVKICTDNGAFYMLSRDQFNNAWFNSQHNINVFLKAIESVPSFRVG
jgi:hypothetical protein